MLTTYTIAAKNFRLRSIHKPLLARNLGSRRVRDVVRTSRMSRPKSVLSTPPPARRSGIRFFATGRDGQPETAADTSRGQAGDQTSALPFVADSDIYTSFIGIGVELVRADYSNQ